MDDETILGEVPLHITIDCLPRKYLDLIAKQHNIFVSARTKVGDVREQIHRHECSDKCGHFLSVFLSCLSKAERWQLWYKQKEADRRKVQEEEQTNYTANPETSDIKFPPCPPDMQLRERIINGFIEDTSPSAFQEHRCAVCGQLVPD